MRKLLSWQQGVAFLRHVVPAVIRPIHAIWNQFIGLFFLLFGAVFGFRTAHYAWSHDVGRSVITGAATAIMAWYGVGSFLKARRISRS